MNFLAAAFALALSVAIQTHAADCDEIFVVIPPRENGGTFFLEAELDPLTGSRRRLGYLGRGRLVRLALDGGSKKDLEQMVKEPSGDRRPYIPFVGAYGSAGLIKSNSIEPVSAHLGAGAKCEDDSFLVVPINPYKEVELLQSPSARGDSPVLMSKFSRSVIEIVVSGRGIRTLTFDDGDGPVEREYYEVVSYGSKGQPSSPPRPGLLDRKLEGSRFLLAPLSPSAYQAIEPAEERNALAKFVSWLAEKITDPDARANVAEELITALGKSCRQSVKVHGEIGLEAPPFSGLKGILAVKTSFKYPAGSRYTLDRYVGLKDEEKLTVMKQIRCVKDGPDDSHAWRVHVTGLKENVGLLVHQSSVLSNLPKVFVVPEISGVARSREYMVALKANEGTDAFTAYFELGLFLEKNYFGVLAGLDPIVKERGKSLLLQLLVDPSGWADPGNAALTFL